MRTIKFSLLFMLTWMSVNAQKAIPTDEQLKTISTGFSTIKRSAKTSDEKRLDIKNLIDESDKLYDINKLTLSQIRTLASGGALYAEEQVKDWIFPLLLQKANNPNAEGAEAQSILVTNYYPSRMSEWIAAYEKLLTHGGIQDFLKTNNCGDVFGRLQFLNKEAIGKSKLVEKMIPLLDYQLSEDAKGNSVIFFDVIADKATGVPEKTIELVRSKIAVFYKELSENTKPGSKADHYKNVHEYINGAYARNMLIDNRAPEIAFKWYSSGNVNQLSDLKGKVVIIDFWAVWCKPCIGSFPNIRKLAERYKDYPVEIIGITSIQGYHMDLKNKKRVMLKDQPEEEMRLMPEFMQEKDITWRVAYSKSCFNPDYGVRGIPHVAIIDANGVVRYNRLRPYFAPYHEAEKIDSLLKEAGLPFPQQPMEQTNFADN